MAGSGGVRADVTGSAKVTVMESGDIDLGEGATYSITKMVSGEVTCGSGRLLRIAIAAMRWR